MTLGDVFVSVWCAWSAEVDAGSATDVSGWLVLSDALGQLGHRRLARRVSRAFKHHRRLQAARRARLTRPRIPLTPWLDQEQNRYEIDKVLAELADMTGRHPWGECKRPWGMLTK